MDARTLSAPVARVTCLEDRAVVERRGSFAWGPGSHRIRIDNVTPLVVDRSLRAEAQGASVVDVRVVRSWREKAKGGVEKDASRLRKRVHALERSLAEAQAALMRFEAKVRILSDVEELALRRVAEESGAGHGDVERWKRDLARIREELSLAQEKARGFGREAVQTKKELDEAEAAVRTAELPESELTASLELSIEVRQEGAIELWVSYLVPSALWRPAYRATLKQTPEGERLTLEADAVLWQRTGEVWDDVEIHVSTARPTLGTRPPSLIEDRLELRDRTTEERRVVDVSVREEVIQTTGEGAASVSTMTEMPGVDDGGETRVIRVEGRSRVPSDGEPHRVHLFRFETAAKSELVGAPELSALVARVARFDNVGPNVLLAGPIELLRESGYVGRGNLKFAAQGEKVKLGFGSEDALRVARDVQRETSESKLTGRRNSDVKVKLFVSNAGGTAVKVALEERIPASEISEVEVKLDPKKATVPPAAISDDGIVRFELELGPNQQRTLQFEWGLSAAAKVSGI